MTLKGNVSISSASRKTYILYFHKCTDAFKEHTAVKLLPVALQDK